MARIESAFTDKALEFVTQPGFVDDFLEHPEHLAPASQALAAYLAQLEEEGYASRVRQTPGCPPWIEAEQSLRVTT